MYHFCTYFDRNYLYKGIALYRSLVRHSGPFTLWILCFDNDACNVLAKLDLPQVRLISLDDFERGDHALLEAKRGRNRVEYYWTCTPSLPLYILKHNPEVEVITYLDADLYFYADPAPIHEEFGDNSILIIEHRYGPGLAHLEEENGTYNVGWVSFRRDTEGLSCLRWWRERCLEWCYARKEDGKSADQKYLEEWPSRFGNVVVLQHKGAGMAPWNTHNYHVTVRDNHLMVDTASLIFYHFHGLAIHNQWIFAQYPGYGIPAKSARLIYPSYIRELRRAIAVVREVEPGFDFGFTPLLNSRRLLGGFLRRRHHWLFVARNRVFVLLWVPPLPDVYTPRSGSNKVKATAKNGF